MFCVKIASQAVIMERFGRFDAKIGVIKGTFQKIPSCTIYGLEQSKENESHARESH